MSSKQQDVIKVLEDTVNMVNRETYLSLEDIEQFKEGIKDYPSLFDRELKKYIKELSKKVNELVKVSVPLQTKTLTREKWDKYNREHLTILHWFDGQDDMIKEKFKDYLN